MPKIIPIRNLKNTSELSELCNNSKEPVFVTKNGYGEMVIMNMELYNRYEKSLFLIQVQEALEHAEKDVQEGRTKDAFQSLNNMRKKYGL